MKELKMFPQITEETEENLLNLEEEPKSPPYSSTPPLNPSCSSSESPPEAPSSPNHENQVPCPLPTITTEDVDRTVSPNHQNPSPDTELSTPPPRTRMRSLSGGAYRLTPAPSTGRHRRQSGDDVLSRVSPSRRATLFDQFRPRSKSDSKGKRPTFLTSLKNSLLGGSVQRKSSLEADPPMIEPFQPPCDYKPRPRSGSETKGGTMSKVIDLFRNRSHSVSYDSKGMNSLLVGTVQRQSSLEDDPPVIEPFQPPIDYKLRPRSGSETKGGTMSKMIDLFRNRSNSVSYDSKGLMVQPAFVMSNDKAKRRRKKALVNTYRSEDETGDSRFDFGSIDEEKIIPSFFSARTCYDAMPLSGKVIVLSTDLQVKHAFSCLVKNEIRSVTLWESSSSTFVGMLTISDFINVLRDYYHNSREVKDIENQKIATWRTKNTRPLIKISPDESLVNATKILIEERIHRLPVFCEKNRNVLVVISRRKLLQYLYLNLMKNFGKVNLKVPSCWKKSLGDLRSEMGTWENIATISNDTKVIDALNIFSDRQVSALPVISEGKVVDIFAKFDVFGLAKEQTYDNLDMTVKEALTKFEGHEHLYCFELDETLETVIERFYDTKAHRLVAVTEERSVIGILSLSDVLKFLVLQPVDDSALASDTIDEAPEGAVGGQDDSSVFMGSGTETSGNIQKSSSLEKQDSSDLSEDFGKLKLGDTPEPLSEVAACEEDP